MKIKRYEARDINTALQMIKSELGPEAIILSTKRLNKGGGVLGGVRKPMVEVVAGIDYEPPQSVPSKETQPQINRSRAVYSQTNSNLSEISCLRTEILSLRKMVQTAVTSRQITHQTGNRSLDTLTAHLESIGMDNSVICSLLGGVVLDDQGDSNSCARLQEIVGERLMDQVLVGESTWERGEFPRVLAFVGPTGAGKTTTAAKLAAVFALRQGKKVLLVSADNYRIAASEQLKTYARILGVPFVAILKDEELSRMINANRDRDVILIDTAGRNQHNEDHMKEVARYLYAHPAIEGHLVLSATTQNGDMEDIFEKYSALSVRGCIFSKIDESRFYGPIFNQAVRFRLPIAYFTTGQRVPEDIEAASQKLLKNLLWNGLREN
ncbi:MAG: flagellar biosynthesis protein FlhF [Pseudomonadota bacterium]